MKPSTAELTERDTQLQRAIQTLREQLATWQNDPAMAIKGDYPTKYTLHQAIAQHQVERRLLARQLQIAQGK